MIGRMRRFLVLVLGFVPASISAGEKGRLPNVVFLMADDLGWAEVGCYGQKKIKTPRLDRMAREGLRFTDAYSGSPVCAPSRCVLMTGKHGGHAAVRDNKEVRPEGQHPLPAAEITLAELFKRMGYVTAAIGKWGLGPPGSEGDPLRQGFDHFFGYNCQRHAHNHYPTWIYRNRDKVQLEGNTGKLTGKHHTHDMMEAEALDFIRRNKEKPFFLYVPFAIPHVAIQVPEDSLAAYRGLWDDPPYKGGKGYLPHPAPRAGYAAMVTRMDRSVGRILDLLAELGLDDNTLVVFTSDNGATHGGVGGSDSIFFLSCGILGGFKGSVDEGGLRVPFIARWPGRIPAGKTSELPTYFPDVLPTLLDAIGRPELIPKGLDGLSIAPTLFGHPEKQKKHQYLFWEFAGYGGQQAVRLGDWKGVRRNIRKGNLKVELYDLGKDEGQKHDVAASHPDVVARIERIMAEARVPSEAFPLKALDEK